MTTQNLPTTAGILYDDVPCYDLTFFPLPLLNPWKPLICFVFLELCHWKEAMQMESHSMPPFRTGFFLSTQSPWDTCRLLPVLIVHPSSLLDSILEQGWRGTFKNNAFAAQHSSLASLVKPVKPSSKRQVSLSQFLEKLPKKRFLVGVERL